MVSKILSYVVAALFGLVGGAVAASFLGPTSEALERTVVGALAGALVGMFSGTLVGEIDAAKASEEARAPIALLIGLVMGILGATQTELVRTILIDLGVR
ncbi:MAG: hypothetical protein AB7K24_15925 [Gemmataceae bacterium]